MRLLVQQHLLLSLPGQFERIHQLLCPLRLFTAVRVRVQTRLLARVVGHAAGQYEALVPLERHHASPRPGYRLCLACRASLTCVLVGDGGSLVAAQRWIVSLTRPIAPVRVQIAALCADQLPETNDRCRPKTILSFVTVHSLHTI